MFCFFFREAEKKLSKPIYRENPYKNYLTKCFPKQFTGKIPYKFSVSISSDPSEKTQKSSDPLLGKIFKKAV